MELFLLVPSGFTAITVPTFQGVIDFRGVPDGDTERVTGLGTVSLPMGHPGVIYGELTSLDISVFREIKPQRRQPKYWKLKILRCKLRRRGKTKIKILQLTRYKVCIPFLLYSSRVSHQTPDHGAILVIVRSPSVLVFYSHFEICKNIVNWLRHYKDDLYVFIGRHRYTFNFWDHQSLRVYWL